MSDLSNVGVPGARHSMPGVVYPPVEHLKRAVEAGFLGNQTLVEAYMETHAKIAQRPALMGPEGNFTHAQLDDITTGRCFRCMCSTRWCSRQRRMACSV